MSVPYIIVCADTYEFIYPSLLFSTLAQELSSSAIRDIDAAVKGNMELPLRALALLTSSRATVEDDGGPLALEPGADRVVGRWFNKRVAILTAGKLFNKLRDVAEGQIAEARLKAIAPKKDPAEMDFLVESILDGISFDGMTDEPDDDAPDAPEETDMDKEEFVPVQQEYTNVSLIVRDYLVTAGIASADEGVDPTTEVIVELSFDPDAVDINGVEKIKMIKVLRDTGVSAWTSLTDAKLAVERMLLDGKTLRVALSHGAADTLKTSMYPLGVVVNIKPIPTLTATAPTTTPKMKVAKASKADTGTTVDADALAAAVAEAVKGS